MNVHFRWGIVASAALVTLTLVGLSASTITPRANAEPESTTIDWSTGGNKATSKSFIGTTNNKPLIFKTNKAERMRLTEGGRVGIGTDLPEHALQVQGVSSLGGPGSVYGYRVVDGNGKILPTLGFNVYAEHEAFPYNAGSGGFGGIFQFSNSNGDLTYYTASNTSPGNAHINTPRLTIDKDGNVGIGASNTDERLAVKGTFAAFDSEGIALATTSDRTVIIGELAQSTTNHLCYFQQYVISSCSSAAEYVPSIDSGKGFPETADLVSIAPDVPNPYGDTHGPFTVQKATQACDPNLLGYIVKPESGADGVNLNEHYLPLAIYGYFPAKVTMENGAIQRGDAITSSSKAGYGMKATDACKVIGYALQDATTEGTIQVFANFGDNAAAQVTQLQQEKDALKAHLLKLDARLAALESGAFANGVAVKTP